VLVPIDKAKIVFERSGGPDSFAIYNLLKNIGNALARGFKPGSFSHLETISDYHGISLSRVLQARLLGSPCQVF